jgi:hypothetical protein
MTGGRTHSRESLKVRDVTLDRADGECELFSTSDAEIRVKYEPANDR